MAPSAEAVCGLDGAGGWGALERACRQEGIATGWYTHTAELDARAALALLRCGCWRDWKKHEPPTRSVGWRRPSDDDRRAAEAVATAGGHSRGAVALTC
uniref:Uncharacterized protein n=1 Tax=Thermogemmatispora argillosa TaxID=2045280 RepID=A0A455T0Q5_9CHLR|nr:hypothetical protein KTA_11400 [Thermogemmatispora argillosa]